MPESDPTFPSADHGPFIKASLRSVSSGLGVGYNSLANDYEGVNFSSLRMSAIDERDIWMSAQDWLIGQFHRQVTRAWVQASLAAEAITYPNGQALDMRRRDEFMRGAWQGRRWLWVDPKKDSEAAALDVALRVKSISEIIRERGRDPDEVWEELSEDVKRLDELGISAAAVLAATSPQTDDSDDDDPDAQAEDDPERVRSDMETYGTGVRAGAITPQIEDEQQFRERGNLPPLSQFVQDAWNFDGGTRRPVTLSSSPETVQELADDTKTEPN